MRGGLPVFSVRMGAYAILWRDTHRRPLMSSTRTTPSASSILSLPLDALGNVGSRFLSKLAQLKIHTVRDLLWHFPSRYEDFSKVYRIEELEPGMHATVQGRVENVELKHSWRKHWVIVEAEIDDGTGAIRAIWFNQPYVRNALQPGRMVSVSGKVARSEDEMYLSHPTYEVLSAGQEAKSARDAQTVHTGRLVPVYPETRGLTSKGIRALILPLLKYLEEMEEWIPRRILDAYDLPELHKALWDVHFPREIGDALRAKERFAFAELLLLQLWNQKEKSRREAQRAPAIPADIEFLKKLSLELPFTLTLSQKKSLWEIVTDMANPHPMNRLLQGDVGSGKTAVAAIAAMNAARSGYQTAVMAPTEVLAQQHFLTFRRLFAAVRAADQPRIGLLAGGEAKVLDESDLEIPKTKHALRENLRKGAVDIVIGTHALIAEPKKSRGAEEKTKLEFKNLGLVIVDEQHRFGVEQRARLSKAGGLAPHFLSMSATPIPRTLMLTIFGDLECSLITELPSGRKNILTKIVDPGNRPRAYAFIRAQIRKGRQAFVVCPRIEPPTNGEESASGPMPPRPRSWVKLWEVKSVKEEYEKLSKKVFPDLRIAMLHGALPAKEKERIMREFRGARIDILLSTSVIEVGVDVPNATIMMIEGSERFGLAQLYQLRGRVGRGEHQSFCLLFTESSGEATRKRLRSIVEAKNGFELAERDLELRGPGDFVGERQTGLPDIAMRALQNKNIAKQSLEAARLICADDPKLTAYPALQERLADFGKRIHLE